MRLFISYARVDKPLCKQIVAALDDVHEVWYDHRLFSGQDWWAEIQKRLHWCEGLIYLLSPEAVASEYCRKEYDIARKLNKHVFPVLIQARTQIPDDLGVLHYADLSDGLEKMYEVLNALTIAERQQTSAQVKTLSTQEQQQVSEAHPETAVNTAQALNDAAAAMDAQDFDKAVFILKPLMDSGKIPRYTARAAADLLKDAEAALERQAYEREAAFEYAPIVALIKNAATRKHGCAALADFQKDFPDYDPENLAEICAKAIASNRKLSEPEITPEILDAELTRLNRLVLEVLPPPFEWCYISAGAFLMGSDRSKDKQAYNQEPDLHEVTLPAFLMAKYPVTYAQFQTFIDAGDGIRDERWWIGLAKAYQEAFYQEWKIADHPRENVNWYEATAFCRWLDNRLWRRDANPPQEYDSMNAATWLIRLPTEAEWEKAARGTAGRIYPWGDTFDKSKCNTSESDIEKTTPVDKYPAGASPYGVLDMCGNVWEWCLSEWTNPYEHQELEEISISSDDQRVLRGGSFYFGQELARSAYRLNFHPSSRINHFGFRVCCAAPSL